MSDHLASLGALGFTYRMRRLADRISDAGRRFYEVVDVPLEPNWHALLLYIDGAGDASVTEAASALKVSHPSVIEMARRMEAKGLITTSPDPSDGRRRVLALSEGGRRQMPEFKRLWGVIAEELDDIIEATAGSDALGALASSRSTTFWVAMPAWSVPGTHNAAYPCIRFRLISASNSISKWHASWTE